MSADHRIDAARAMNDARDSLSDIEAAVVAMLEPLMGDGSSDASPSWSELMARRADALGERARAAGLRGIARVADMVRERLSTPGVGAAAPDLALAGQWTSGLVAFVGGHLEADARRAWGEDLRRLLGGGVRLDDSALDGLDALLVADEERLALWRATPAAADGAPEVARDELSLLADACEELEQLLQPVFAAWCADGEGHCADPEAVREAIDEFTDRLGHFAAALGFIGLDAVGALLADSAGEVSGLRADPAATPTTVRQALLDWAPRWREAFRRHDDEAIEAALSLHREGGLGERAAIGGAAGQWRAMREVGSRRVERHAPLGVGEQLSLAIADDTDPDVLAQLLRELPALCDALSHSMERLLDGDTTMFEPTRRAAHTLKGAANTAGIVGIARFTHALEDLLLLVEQSNALGDPVLADALGESADTLAGMVDAVAGLGAPPPAMADVYRTLLEWLDRLPATEPSEPMAVDDTGRGRPAPGEDSNGPTVAAREPAPDVEPGAAPDGAAAQVRSTEGEAVLRVPEGLVDRLVDNSTEAVIAVAQMQERLEELGRIRRAIRLGAQRARDLALEAERLVEALRRLAPDRSDGHAGSSEADELGLARHDDLDRLSGRIAEVGADGQVLEAELGEQLEAIASIAARLDRAQGELRDTALRARMIPVADIAPRLARAARQASRMAGRQVELALHGREQLFEARLLQALVEPLGHLIRNAVDHGIEDAPTRIAAGKPSSGRIDVSFERAGGGQLRVVVEDDGRGLDMDRIRERAARRGLEVGDWEDPAEVARVLCAPDFSTRDEATQLSGRGLGLGLVAEAVARRRGWLEIGRAQGGGLRVVASLPLEFASVGVLLLRSPSIALAITVTSIDSIVPAHPVRGASGDACLVEGPSGPLRMVALADLLGLPDGILAQAAGDTLPEPEVALVLARPAGGVEAVRVPPPGAARQVVVHPLPAFMPPIPGLEGAAVLGDGTVAPVIDLGAAAQGGQRSMPMAMRPVEERRPRCLVVDDSVSVRRAMQALASDLGLAVDAAGDGIEALALVDRNPPAIALIDLEMPRMNGLELARALRSRAETAAIPIIMLTSRASGTHRAHALAAGVSHFMPKPFVEDELSKLILDSLTEG